MANLNCHFLTILPLQLAILTLVSLSILSSAELQTFELANYKDGEDSELKFLVIGDWGRKGSFNQSQVAKQMGETGEDLDVDFVISTGDNFYDDGLTGENDPAFKQSFSDIYTAKSLQKPWYSVLGNHDYRGNAEAQQSPQLKELDERWHCKRSFILNTKLVDLFFVDTTPFVNKYFDDPEGDTYDWKDIMPRDKYLSALLKDLNSTLGESQAMWKIVVGHHAIRTIGHHGDTVELVQQLLPILEANKVDMYINGHDHCLEHIKTPTSKIHYLTSGGGSKAWKNDIHNELHQDSYKFYYDGQGFMSVKLEHHEAKIVFYDIFGNPLHKIRLSKQSLVKRHRKMLSASIFG